MAAISPASHLVTAAACEILRPLGLRQRGRSRTWIDDHGWWLGVVEFQPSSWSQGSYLNVGVMWLWQDVGHLEFNLGGREVGHESFRDEAQFAPLAMDLARTAADRITAYRDRFTALKSTAEYLAAQPARRGNPWDNFHAGATAALVGDAPTARDRFGRALQQLSSTDIPWMVQAHETALQLRDQADDTEALRGWVVERVTSCRQKLNLEFRSIGIGDEPQLP
ncbi:hypothetical protein ACIQBJ_25125 [Kitasatospora sp. NPDC088391]|uniref:hypothetical protein n=1 Tax=Kitasatospora sp. NPDC088391 TaxID=3364074 RepID=UPI0037FE5367